jgi:hypothetical protein
MSLHIFVWKSPVPHFTEIRPVVTALIPADRQTNGRNDKTNEYFTSTSTQIYGNISQNVSYSEKVFRQMFREN